MIQVFHIKIILALCFKKRPSMIPNFIIPSEYETGSAAFEKRRCCGSGIVMLSHLFKIKN
jgi:hypothetical protein